MKQTFHTTEEVESNWVTHVTCSCHTSILEHAIYSSVWVEFEYIFLPVWWMGYIVFNVSILSVNETYLEQPNEQCDFEIVKLI